MHAPLRCGKGAAAALLCSCGRLALAALVFLGALLPPARAVAQGVVTVHITMTEFAFHPAAVRLHAGLRVRLVLINRGQIAHQFDAAYLYDTPVRVADAVISIDAPGAGAVRLNPDGTVRIEFVPTRRGRYAFACTLEGHREAGMSGTLDVR